MNYLTYILIVLMLSTGCTLVHAEDMPELDPATEVVLLRIQIEHLQGEIIKLKLGNDACYSDLNMCWDEVWRQKGYLEQCRQAFMKTL